MDVHLVVTAFCAAFLSTWLGVSAAQIISPIGRKLSIVLGARVAARFAMPTLWLRSFLVWTGLFGPASQVERACYDPKTGRLGRVFGVRLKVYRLGLTQALTVLNAIFILSLKSPLWALVVATVFWNALPPLRGRRVYFQYSFIAGYFLVLSLLLGPSTSVWGSLILVLGAGLFRSLAYVFCALSVWAADREMARGNSVQCRSNYTGHPAEVDIRAVLR